MTLRSIKLFNLSFGSFGKSFEDFFGMGIVGLIFVSTISLVLGGIALAFSSLVILYIAFFIFTTIAILSLIEHPGSFRKLIMSAVIVYVLPQLTVIPLFFDHIKVVEPAKFIIAEEKASEAENTSDENTYMYVKVYSQRDGNLIAIRQYPLNMKPLLDKMYGGMDTVTFERKWQPFVKIKDVVEFYNSKTDQKALDAFKLKS